MCYKIDKWIIQEKGKVILTDKIRLEFLLEILKTIKDYNKPLRLESKKYFQIIKYGELFLPPYAAMQDLLTSINKSYKLQEWPDAVKNSYLPKEVDIFNTIINPGNYGYTFHYQ